MTNPLAQDLGGVVRLLEKATPGELTVTWMENASTRWPVATDPRRKLTVEAYSRRKDADTRAIAAAVNFLRTHSAEIAGALAEVERLNAIVNTPQANDFLRAVSTEAEHQRQRWGSDHDRGKTPADWFWLVGYLAGKALHAHAASDLTKAEHHVITAAAALANWHMAMFGNTDMCPGIDGESLLTSPTTGADGDNT